MHHASRPNAVQEKSYAFAVTVIGISRHLQASHEYVLSKQLLKSGTSIGANIEEALQGQSRADFVAKMSIAHKEAFESDYWLRLIADSGLADGKVIAPARSVLAEIIALLTAILRKTKERSEKPDSL